MQCDLDRTDAAAKPAAKSHAKWFSKDLPMSIPGLGMLGLGLMAAGAANAQTFSNTIFFGDSQTDSGYYLYRPDINRNNGMILKARYERVKMEHPNESWPPC